MARALWRFRLARCLIAATMLLVAAGTGSLYLLSAKLWRDTQAQSTREAYMLGVLLTEQTARVLESSALALQETVMDVRDAGALSPDLFRAQVRRPSVLTDMITRLHGLPQLAAIAVSDADGTMLASTTRRLDTPVSVTDRDYFRLCRADPAGGDYVGERVRSRLNERLVFTLGRCITDAEGRFLGVITAAISVDHFMSIYNSLALPADTEITVNRADGSNLVRYPRPAAASAGQPPATIVASRPDRPADLRRSGGPAGRPAVTHVAELDQTATRYLSSTRLADYPVVVDVGLSGDYALKRWRREVTWIVVCGACAVAGLLLLLGWLLTGIERTERSQAALRERNAALTEARTMLEAQADALRESRQQVADQAMILETTLDHIDQGLLMVKADQSVAVYNRRAVEMLNLPEELMRLKPSFTELVNHQLQTREFPFVTDQVTLARGELHVLDARPVYERQRPDGTFLEIRSVRLADGGLVRTYSDVTKRRLAEQRLSFLAYNDELTGLANRRVLSDRLTTAVTTASDAHHLAVLYLDLDRFKLVNDTRGHAVGDALLVQVARRMQACLREADIVARLGGDEFAVVLEGRADRVSTEDIAERLKGAVSAPYEIDDEAVRIGVSIGIALCPQDASDAASLLRSADAALYRAKATGRNTICWHQSDAEQADRGRLILEQDLRLALEREQFELAYQPIFDIRTGLPSGVEALVRWRHPVHGLIMPDAFIPLAEETGLINKLGRWVMREACIEAATWAMPVRLAVNVSSVQFLNAGIEQQVNEALAASFLPAERLDLEVTERLLISDTDAVMATMHALCRRGVRLSMDDFGVGHSSLMTLQRFPFQQVKIDRGFVATLALDDIQADGQFDGSAAIIRAMLTLADALKLEVIAEGVESQAQLDRLRALGCRHVQGFLLQGPQSPEWMRDYLWRCTTARVDDAAGPRAFAALS